MADVNFDRYLDPPEYVPTLCPCGREIDEESLYRGHDTCTECRGIRGEDCIG